jgi:hypothetical protein
MLIYPLSFVCRNRLIPYFRALVSLFHCLLLIAGGPRAFSYQQNDFVIGTFLDPAFDPGDLGKSLANFQKAKQASFNLLLGRQDRFDGSLAANLARLDMSGSAGMNILIADNRLHGFGTFTPSSASSLLQDYTNMSSQRRATMYGYNIGDEPQASASVAANIKNWIHALKQSDPGKLAYLNLLPRYGFTSDMDYEAYLDLYLSDSDPSMMPDVASFDFYPFSTSGFRSDYFYNLRIVKSKAGDRPAWAYVMSLDEAAYDYSNPQQLRFMTFCPIAYGFKGLVYYSYDTPRSKYLSDYSGNGLGTWDTGLYDVGGIGTVPVPADYDGDGKADIAVKTTDGHWLIDDASNGFNGWDVVFSNYGGSDAIPCPADYDGDGKADLAVKTADGRWLIDYAANGFAGWDVSLSGYGGSDAIPCPSDYDGEGKADLAVKTTDGHWLIDDAINGFAGWDVSLSGYGGADAVQLPADYDGDGKADVATLASDGIWRIDYAANGFAGFDVAIPANLGSLTLTGVPADYDGDGKADLAVKTADGRWQIDYASNGFGQWDVVYSGYGGGDVIPCPADYDGDGKTDFALWVPDGTTGTGLVDTTGSTTAKYDSASEINLFVSKLAGPVAMANNFVGAYHKSAYPSGVTLTSAESISNGQIAYDVTSDYIMVGHYRSPSDPKQGYLLVVNKNPSAIAATTLSLRGHYVSASLSQSSSGYAGSVAFTSASTSYSSSSSSTSVTIPALAGGDACILKYTQDPDPKYAAWTSANGLTGAPGYESGILDDPDKDGMENMMEFVLGGNPLIQDSSTKSPHISPQGSNCIFSFKRDINSETLASCLVEYSSTLNGAWTDVAIGTVSSGPDAAGVTVNVTKNTNAPDDVIVSLPTQLASTGRLFIRLKVVAN